MTTRTQQQTVVLATELLKNAVESFALPVPKAYIKATDENKPRVLVQHLVWCVEDFTTCGTTNTDLTSSIIKQIQRPAVLGVITKLNIQGTDTVWINVLAE